MAYIEDRIVHDADSHVMELPDWFDAFAERRVVDAFKARFGKNAFETIVAQHDDADYRSRDADDVMARKNYAAIGSFRPNDRPSVLDNMGVATQLVFPTSANVWLEQLEHGDDRELLFATARATNRAQVEFCRVDPRLLAVAYVPLADREEAPKIAAEAIEAGAKALLVPWACPRDHATSHVDFDRVWAQAVDAGVPILFHVGVADRVLPPSHKINGLPVVPDFHGGEENFRSISYMAIPHGPMQALSMLILDGVMERFPALKLGIIELGASWIPGFMRQLDSAFEAFSRHEERLQTLNLKPSEYVRRQVRVTPYPTEPTGWIIEQSAPEICMFSSDYPHVEGGRNPYGRFERSTEDLDDAALDAFFRRNFEDLMGRASFGGSQ